MAKPPAPFGAGKANRQPSLKGLVMVDTVNGALRVRAWPRSRGRPKTTDQADRQEWFRQVQKSFNYAAPQNVVDIMRAREGTPLLPRDIWTHILSGRACWLELENGRKVFPRMISQKVSDALDTLSQTPGDILIRTPDGWGAAKATDLQGGGGALSQPIGTPNGYDTLTGRTKGAHFQADLPLRFLAATFRWNAVAGHRYRACLVRCDNAYTSDQDPNFSEEWTSNIAGDCWRRFSIPTAIEATRRYAITLTDLDLASGAAFPIGKTTNIAGTWEGFPIGWHNLMRTNSLDVPNGTVFTTGNNQYMVFPEFSAMADTT